MHSLLDLSIRKNSADLNYFCPATISFAEQHSDVVRNILFPSKDFSSLVFSPRLSLRNAVQKSIYSYLQGTHLI